MTVRDPTVRDCRPAAARTRQAADLIRTTYIDERFRYEGKLGNVSPYAPGPAWDGGQDRGGRHRRRIWPRVAQFIENEQVDNAEKYVRFVFDRRGRLDSHQLKTKYIDG